MDALLRIASATVKINLGTAAESISKKSTTNIRIAVDFLETGEELVHFGFWDGRKKPPTFSG
jgi:hypothetical protein